MSLIPNTFTGIVSAVKALTEDDSIEFEAYIPTAIFLAEENLIKKLDTAGLTFIASVTAVAGDNILAKPSGQRFTKDIHFITSSNSFVQPNLKTNDFIRDYWPTGKTSTSSFPFGQPKYYGTEDKDNWIIAPTPASAYVFTVQHTKQFEHISAANSTNYFTSHVPDALFYGTMVGMAEFMKDWNTVPIWTQRYIDAVESVNNEGRRDRRDDSENPLNPAGGQNTLLGDN